MGPRAAAIGALGSKRLLAIDGLPSATDAAVVADEWGTIVRSDGRVLTLLAVLILSGCATRQKPPAACPQLDPGKEADIIFPLLQKEFGYLREGYTAKVVARSVDKRGDAMLELGSIMSSTATDSVGGERLTIVVQKCTLKVLSARRPADRDAQRTR